MDIPVSKGEAVVFLQEEKLGGVGLGCLGLRELRRISKGDAFNVETGCGAV